MQTQFRNYLHTLSEAPLPDRASQCIPTALHGIRNPQLMRMFFPKLDSDKINTPTLLVYMYTTNPEIRKQINMLFAPVTDVNALYTETAMNSALMLYDCVVETDTPSRCTQWALHTLGKNPVVALDIPLQGQDAPVTFPGSTVLGSNGATRMTLGFDSPPAMVHAVRSVVGDMQVPEKLTAEYVARECCDWAAFAKGKNWREVLVSDTMARARLPCVEWSSGMYWVFFPPGALGDPVERNYKHILDEAASDFCNSFQ